jgi:hypothetical protein
MDPLMLTSLAMATLTAQVILYIIYINNR